MNARSGQTLRELCAGLDMARQSVSKRLAVLEAANLVTTLWRGREKFHYLNAAPINEISERWIDQYDQHRVHALSDLKRALEDTAMQKPRFVYTTYIKTTPELADALDFSDERQSRLAGARRSKAAAYCWWTMFAPRVRRWMPARAPSRPWARRGWMC